MISVRCVDDRIATEGGFLAQAFVDPCRRKPEGGFRRVQAGKLDLVAARIHHQQLADIDVAATGFDFLDANDVAVGVELNIVEDSDRWHDETHVACDLAPQGLDLVGELLVILAVDQRQQCIADFQAQFVHPQGSADWLLSHGNGRGFPFLRVDDVVGRLLSRFLQIEGKAARAAREQQEGNGREARQQGHGSHHEGRHAQRLRVARKLIEQRLVGRAFNTGFRHEQAGRGRHNQCRDLADETVADRQQRIGVSCIAEAQVVLRDPDDDATDNIDEGNQQTGHGVAANEFGGTVHGAEERALLFEIGAPGARLVLVDQSGREVGIDGHLLARHRVEGEACRDFGDTSRAFRDDDEVDDDQDCKDDNPDNEVALHHEVAEGLDDLAGAVGAFMSLAENEAR